MEIMLTNPYWNGLFVRLLFLLLLCSNPLQVSLVLGATMGISEYVEKKLMPKLNKIVKEISKGSYS
jgi:hypothetical protein